MLPQLALKRDIDENAGRIVVADVEYDRRLARAAVVDELGRFISKRDAGETAGWIKTDREFAAIVLDDTGYGSRLGPDLAIVVGHLPEVGAVEALHSAEKVRLVHEGAGVVTAPCRVSDPAERQLAGAAQL